VLQAVEPFMSSGDILAGSRGERVIASELAETDFGIVCVTAENQREPWINFEAGALAKLPQGHVVPIGIDLAPADIERPLGQFQARTISREDLREVVVSLNAACNPSISIEILDETFDRWWSDLEQGLQFARDLPQAAKPVVERSEDSKLDEVLETVRALASPAPVRLSALDEESLTEQIHRIISDSGFAFPFRVSLINNSLTVSAPARLSKDVRRRVQAIAVIRGVDLTIEDSGELGRS
jgi:hypothetical protein